MPPKLIQKHLENEMYEGLALLPPDLIELALSELSKIVKNSNEEDDNYNNSINSSNSSSSSELNATQHLQQVRNICLTGNLSMRQQRVSRTFIHYENTCIISSCCSFSSTTSRCRSHASRIWHTASTTIQWISRCHQS